MNDDMQKKEGVVAEPAKQDVVPAQTSPRAPRDGGRSFGGGQRGFDKKRGGGRKGGPREERVKEFDQKILTIRRVTRVASGGRRFSFSVAIVVGNRNGSVGVGTGKAGDTSLAIDKAVRNAKKHMIKINRNKGLSISHKVESKYSSARIMMMPAVGRGLIAGSAVRDVLELGGVNDVMAKIFSGSKNKLNIAQGAVMALKQLAPSSVSTVVKK
jgi:small subunit ribosomal protein S5